MSRTLQLRTRLSIAGLLLIATTVATGVWGVIAFRRVSRVLGDTVSANEAMTDVTTSLDGYLEREDDALVLVLAQRPNALAERRARVDATLTQVIERLDLSEKRAKEALLRDAITTYQTAVDRLVAAADQPDARARYHEEIHPLLLKAIAEIDGIRDDHFSSSQRTAEWAANQATQSMAVVATISLLALGLLILVVVHLARVVMAPLDEMTRAVAAIRTGDFSHRVRLHREDELGRLGAGLNRMADELEEFRRTNIGEVIRAKETLEATLEALPDAVVVVDNERHVSAVNPRAADTLGSMRGGLLSDIPIPEPTRAAVDAAMQSGSAPDASVDLAKSIELCVGDSPRRFLPRVVPIAGRRGAVLVLSDVTDLARMDQMRLELVAVASHELRTPLTTMRMTLSMLQERASGYAEHDRELVATAMVGVEQLSAQVDEYLDLTRIEAGQLKLAWMRLSLEDLVRTVARAIAPASDQAGVKLDVEVEPGVPPSIAGDRPRLATVVSNLLSNAIKHTPSGGRIVLRVSPSTDASAVSIDVSDSGPGVPAEFRERVFDRFFRVAPPGDPSLASAGVGIGLYIARQVVEAHGGQIRCSAGPLGGASFTVTIPVERPAV